MPEILCLPLIVRDNEPMEHVVTKTHLHQGPSAAAADLAYWLTQPVQARLAAVEVLRQQYIQTLPDAEQRLQRVCRVTQLKQR